jgi:hypothetical protein
MFDEHARNLIEQLPQLPGLDRSACRRALSAAYFHVVRIRLNAQNDQQQIGDLAGVRSLLRKLADALESLAVFDRLHGVGLDANVESACAFVAAEAIALLGELQAAAATEQQPEAADVICDERQYARIEAALLYMLGGYDVDAAALARNLPEFVPAPGVEPLAAATPRNALYLLSRLRAMCLGDIHPPTQSVPPYTGFADQPPEYETLVGEIRLPCYELLARAVNAYLGWLGGDQPEGLDQSRDWVQQVRRATLPPGHLDCAAMADVYHLSSLLLAAIERTSQRSVIHHTPVPDAGGAGWVTDFSAYLTERARGADSGPGRPFLWPSALEFVEKCLPGPKCDAVIGMPTGSGKSFLAELAIAHALGRGSVIYLAPTNALVHQVRRELSKAFQPFQAVRVKAFIGTGEYSGQLEDILGEAPTQRFVAVMTPEKCALALRLQPEAFCDLALCVFDECHLINDETRGVTADILMAQLFAAAPDMRFLLMSAMVSNPEELAGWLAAARQRPATPSVSKWRPSRTLRGLLVVDRPSSQANAQAAKSDLMTIQRTQPRRVCETFAAELALVGGLSGPWTLDAQLDYRSLLLRRCVQAKVEVRNGRASEDFGGWKNSAATILADSLARAGIPVIAFILSSRHHAFSQADDIAEPLPSASNGQVAPPDVVNAWLEISAAELGVQTPLRDLLGRGVGVHTSAMLQTEQAAAERMFNNGYVKLMFATPTLAQGLNLPAIGVVVAGTSMGDPRDADKIAGVGGRAGATILNSFGRAGRPGFANQGLAVLVSDKPLFTTVAQRFDPRPALDTCGVLREPDAAVEVRSPIEPFLDRVLLSDTPFSTATEVELELTTLLAESPAEDHAGNVLRRTFAGYRRRQMFTDAASEQVRQSIAGLKQAFLQEPGLPPWLNTAAMKGGVDVFRAWRMWDAYGRRGRVDVRDAGGLSVMQWFTVFIETIRELPPRRIEAYMADEEVAPRPRATRRRGRKARVTVLTKLRDAAAGKRLVDSVPWQMPPVWHGLWDELGSLVAAFLQGKTYAEIAQLFWNIPPQEVTQSRGTGKAIPAVFGLVGNVFEPLARDAGCFVALNEHAWNADAGTDLTLPERLQALPLCIRYGCDSLDSLGWFRFGYRQRVCAHALALAFPVPSEITGDADRAAWIHLTRRKWLSGDFPELDNELLTHARTVVREAGD